jgi:hypothetical protein
VRARAPICARWCLRLEIRWNPNTLQNVVAHDRSRLHQSAPVVSMLEGRDGNFQGSLYALSPQLRSTPPEASIRSALSFLRVHPTTI